MNLVEIDDESEQVQVERSENEIENLAPSCRLGRLRRRRRQSSAAEALLLLFR